MAEKQKTEKKKEPVCPYCNGEMAEDSPFCEPCKIRLFWCPKCKLPMPRETTKCPHCGTVITAKK